jgi:hypothetical protein
MTYKKHQSVKHRKRCSKAYKLLKIKGGDASNYAQSVYGGIGQQQALSDNNHVIAMKQVSCNQSGGAEPAASVSILSPATLQQGGNSAAAVPVNVSATTVIPTVTPTVHSPAVLIKGGSVLKEKDENESEEVKQLGGESILADLAVPAVLLVANQVMTKRHRKSGKKSRRYRKKGSYKRRR